MIAFENQIIQTDARLGFDFIPSKSVDCIITSPPYWKQRKYTDSLKELGNEKFSKEYTLNIAEVFKHCNRVLKDTGTLFIVIDDKYLYSQLQLIPAELANRLKYQGWCLRQKLIWHKPNPMPESVKNRFTHSYEEVYFFTKKPSGYYFDAESVKTESKSPVDNRSDNRKRKPTKLVNGMRKSGIYEKANLRSVLSVPLQPCKGQHTATFPEKLVEPLLLAGCSPNGVVFDPFMGTGTVAVVAKRNGRKFIGLEIDQATIDYANERIKND